jgi:hypothetical protein
MRLFYLQLDTLYIKFQSVLHTEHNALPLEKNETDNVRINVTLRWVRVTTLPWKSKTVTYSQCVLIALVIKLAPYLIIICGLSGSTIFLHITL